MIEYVGETYLTVSEIAQRFKISRGTCYSNILKHVEACYLPGRKNAMYRQSEVERFSEVRVCSVSAERILAAKQEPRPA